MLSIKLLIQQLKILGVNINMPSREENHVDPFSVIVLIGIVLLIVFLIICCVYFYDLMKMKPPSKGESTFLFWTSMLLAIVAVVIAILAMVHIFTHKHVFNEIVEKKIVAAPAPTIKPKSLKSTTLRTTSPPKDDRIYSTSFADRSRTDTSGISSQLAILEDDED